jgi:competence protein ComEC
MEHDDAPALVPCAAFVLGAAAVQGGFLVSHPGPVVALAGLGVALGRRTGGALAALALGLLVAFVARPEASPSPAEDRPVEVVGRITDHPRPLGNDDWRLHLRVSAWRQGAVVTVGEREVWLELGGEGGAPALGSRVRVRGYWLASQPLANGLPRRPGPPRLRVKSLQLVTVEAPPGPFARLSGALRCRLEASPAFAGPGLGAAFARALVLGDPGRIPVRVRQSLSRLGLAHVLSVSGLHVGFVAGLGVILGRRLPRSFRLLPAAGLVLLYLAAVGPLPPLLRSAGMAALAAAALLLERPPAVANALALVAAGLVASAPGVLGDLSFVLSLTATAGLVLGAPWLLAGWGHGEAGAAGPWTRGLAATLSAQLATVPWTLPIFALLTPWAAVANLVAAPWLAALLGASLLAAAVGLVAPGLAGLAAPLLDGLAAPAKWLELLPVSPWVATPVHVSPLLAAAAALVLAAALRWPRRGLPLLLLVAAAFGAWRFRAPEGPLEIAFLDVGQGDGILVRDGRRALLLDAGGSLGGGDFGGRVVLPALARFGLTRLETVVVSHEDRDHCGGLVDLAGLVAIEEVAFAPGVADTPCGRALAEVAPSRRLAAGDVFALGRWSFTVLHPPAESVRHGNDASLVILAEARGRRFLLTGDIEAAAEAALATGAGDLGADVLKVAHHGSKSSSTEAFLERVAPRLAVVSAGRRNAFGHPAPGVLERLHGRGTRVLRTDRDGIVVLRVEEGGRLSLDLPGGPK